MNISLQNQFLIKSISILFVSILVASCSFLDSKTGLEKDIEERTEVLGGIFATYWKGAKISIRSMPITENMDSIDFDEINSNQKEQLNLGEQLSRIYDWEAFLKDEPVATEPLSASDFMELAGELYALSDNIKDINEDRYPTFIEVVSNSKSVLKKEALAIPPNWNNSKEHWLFALVMEMKLGFGSWKTYELDKVTPKNLGTTDFVVAAHIHRGIDFLRNEWFYLAESEFTKTVNVLNGGSISLAPKTSEMLAEEFNLEGPAEEQFRYHARGITYLLRAFSKHQTEEEELLIGALEDIEKAMEDFAKAGIDNELVWLAESYLYIRQEDSDRAINSLNKLAQSNYFSEKERDLINDAVEELNSREPDKALNVITDKVIMYRLGLNYAMSYANEIQWMKLLENTEEGRRILAKFNELEQTLEKAKKYINIDSVAEKGKELWEDL